MMHLIPSTYEPNTVFSQFLGSASVTFFFSLLLSLLPLLVFPFLAFLVFSFLSVPSSFSFFAFFSFLSFLSFLVLFVLCFFFPIDLRLSCVCVVIDTTCNVYVVVFLGWQAV